MGHDCVLESKGVQGCEWMVKHTKGEPEPLLIRARKMRGIAYMLAPAGQGGHFHLNPARKAVPFSGSSHLSLF